jgi:phosphohistidine phosphatase|tara:strand:+ start:314 stop:763 length:450 start_codon:yes stop_codon:yes gene_type:complete
MPTRLIVMRHASSGWNSPQQSDHERVLTEGGRLEAPRISQALTDLDWIPNLAIVSSSARTRETHSLLMEIPHEIRSEVYGASLETLLTIVDGIEVDNTTLVLGHNPGCEMLVATLSGEYHRMPPATCALFSKDGPNWNLEKVLRANELD